MVITYKKRTFEECIYKFLDIVDCMQSSRDNYTTPAEKKLLVEFYLLPDSFAYYRFTTLAKKEIMKRAKAERDWVLTNQNINNKLYELIRKKILWRDDDGVIYAQKWLEKALAKLKKAYLKDKSSYSFTFKLEPFEDQ